ncbi:MAG: aryl-sulfate sulfotransferase [bacterium]
MKLIKIIIVFTIFFNFGLLLAIPPTVGLIEHSAGSMDDGYVLFAPMLDSTTYLIDKCGYVVHKWNGSYIPGLSVYLLPNGKLLKTGVDKASHFTNGGGGGYIDIVNWDGTVEWRYKLSTLTECQHHDVKYLPNGNILAIVYDSKNFDEIQIAGKDPETFNEEFWSEKILELRPIGKDSAEIVWEWKVWDHLVQDFDSTRENFGIVSVHPELIDVNFESTSQDVDWHHFNSIDYNPELDQILLSSCFFSEIYIIDHSTTTAEAADHIGGKYKKGGDLLYRWGNPLAYKRGTVESQKLFNQHDATWIPSGYPYENRIMIFNNGKGILAGIPSSIDIIQPPVNSSGEYNNQLPYSPATSEWSYTSPNPSDFFSVILSGTQMLENGNVLICDGPQGLFFEIDTAKNIVWRYINPVTNNGILAQGKIPMLTNNSFRCTLYPNDFPGFDGKDLSRMSIIENENVNSEACTLNTSIKNAEENLSILYPNPTDNNLNIETYLKDFVVEIYDISGKKRITKVNMRSVNTDGLENGTYYVKLLSKLESSTQIYKFIIRR